MQKILLLIMTLIIGVLGYKVYSDKQNSKNISLTQHKQYAQEVKKTAISAEKKTQSKKIKNVVPKVLNKVIPQKSKETTENLDNHAEDNLDNYTEDEINVMIEDGSILDYNLSSSDGLSEDEIKKEILKDVEEEMSQKEL